VLARAANQNGAQADQIRENDANLLAAPKLAPPPMDRSLEPNPAIIGELSHKNNELRLENERLLNSLQMLLHRNMAQKDSSMSSGFQKKNSKNMGQIDQNPGQ